MREGMRGGCWLTSGESEWDRECGAAKGGGDEGKGGLCRRRRKEGEGEVEESEAGERGRKGRS